MLGYITKYTYLEHGKYSRKPIDRHFGSWNKMLKELGLPINCEINITEHDLLAELKKTFNNVGSISAQVIKDIGKYGIEVYQRRFGSLNKALKLAGIEPNLYTQSQIANVVIGMVSEIIEEEPIFEKNLIGWSIKNH